MTQARGSVGSDDAGAAPRGAARETLTPAEFEAMTSEIARPLHATALRLTRNRDDADDLVQDTLFRAFRGLAGYQKGTRFRAWIFRILHNAFINRIRRAQLAPAAVDPTELDPHDREHPVPDVRALEAFPALADEHFDERVKEAVEGLPEPFRMPLLLFSVGGLSYQEIADTLEIPIGTVMSRLHRARKQLRGQLLDYAREHGLAPPAGAAAPVDGGGRA